MDKFQLCLLNTAHIKSKYIPCYIKWVSECHNFPNKPHQNIIAADEQQKFIKHLYKTHEDWQVKQAEHALRLYNFFLSQEKQEGQKNHPCGKEKYPRC